MNNLQATSISNEFSSFSNSSTEWTQIENYIDTYALYAENYRNIAVLCLGGVSILLLILFTLSCMCSLKCCTFCQSSLILLFVPLLFLFSSVHVPAAVFVADMCPQVDAYIINQTDNANATQYFQYYTQCQNMSLNPLFQVNETVSEYLQVAEIYLQNAKNHGDNASIAKYQTLVNEFSELQGYIAELSDCNTTSTSWNKIKENICTEFLDGIGYMMVFNIITAFLFWILVAIGYHLVKMFRNPMDNFRDSKQYIALNKTPISKQPLGAPNKNGYNTFNANGQPIVMEEVFISIPPPYIQDSIDSVYIQQNVNRSPFDLQERSVFDSKDEENMTYPLLYPKVNANPTAPPSE